MPRTARDFAGIGGPSRAPLPSLRFGMSVSESFFQITSQQRFWNTAAKQSLTALLKEHHRQVIPKHFQFGAAQKYNYQKRAAVYVEKKRLIYKSRTDLVKSRRLRASVTGMFRGPTFSGTLSRGMAATIRMRIPWPVNRDPKRPGAVTLEKMKGEITQVTWDEAHAAARDMRVNMSANLKALMAANRSRQRKVR